MGYTRGVGGSPCQALWRPTGHAHQWGIMERDRKAFSARGREAPPRQDPWRGGECRGDRGPSERSHGTDSQPWGEQGLDSQGAPVTSLLRMLTASLGWGDTRGLQGGWTKTSPPPRLPPGPPQHDRSGAQSPADPSKVSWGIPASHAAGGGQAPGGCESRWVGATSPGGHRPLLCCWGKSSCPQDHRQPEIPGAAPSTPHPSPGTFEKAAMAAAQRGAPARTGASKQRRKGPPPPSPPRLRPLGSDSSRGQGSTGVMGSLLMGAGLPALDQTPGLREGRPSEGHAVLSPSCRAQTGGKAEKKGGHRAAAAPRSLLTSPLRAAGLAPSLSPSTPPRGSTLQPAGSKSGASAPPGQDAGSRRGHSCRT